MSQVGRTQNAFVYVDGFNLYHGCLEESPWKWLNPKALVEKVLPGTNAKQLHFFTAGVSAPPDDPEKPTRQQMYWRALETVPEVRMHKGHFLSNPKWFPLSELNGDDGQKHQPLYGAMACVRRFEEKGSDVNLAAQMLLDAADRSGEYDTAIVVSNDSDLVSPISQIRERYRKKVGILCPHDVPSVILQRLATFHRMIVRRHLAQSQFPLSLITGTGTIQKPDYWNVVVCNGSSDTNGFLDNYYPSSFDLDGTRWSHVAEYLRAQRQVLRDFHTLNASKAPSLASYLGSPFMLQVEWNAIRSDLLRRALKAKFQDARLAELLRRTGKSHIVCYNNPRNMKPTVRKYLGRALEVVRAELPKTPA